jgi:hypothetical protein
MALIVRSLSRLETRAPIPIVQPSRRGEKFVIDPHHIVPGLLLARPSLCCADNCFGNRDSAYLRLMGRSGNERSVGRGIRQPGNMLFLQRFARQDTNRFLCARLAYSGPRSAGSRRKVTVVVASCGIDASTSPAYSTEQSHPGNASPDTEMKTGPTHESESGATDGIHRDRS